MDSIEREWNLNQPGVVASASAVVRGRLLGAEWIVTLRPDASLEHPALQIEVVDAVRAETLATGNAKLRLRPRARWFRNPPPDDLNSVLVATRQTLNEALAYRASLTGRRNVSLLFIHPEGGADETDALAMEKTLAEVISSRAPGDESAGWRALGQLSADAPRGEGLLHAAGFIADGALAPPAAIADVFFWGRLETIGESFRLRFWLWSESGRAIASSAEGSRASIADDVVLAMHEAIARDAAPLGKTAAGKEKLRQQLAGELVSEARALAAAAPETRPASATTSLATRLLELAAFLDPLDREIQELRIISSLRDLPRGMPGNLGVQEQTEVDRRRVNLALEYARLADRFWSLPDNRYDLRLLAASFTSASWDAPGNRARAARVAPILARMPVEELRQCGSMFEGWMRLCETPDDTSLSILEIIFPIVARLKPERLETPPHGGTRGWIPSLLEAYRKNPSALKRFHDLVDRLPPSGASDSFVVPGVAPVIVQNSPVPFFPLPANASRSSSSP